MNHDEIDTDRGGRAAGEELRDAAAWAERYDAGDTPWDIGEPHGEILRRIATGELAPRGAGRALVPGCGRGHDALALARAGWSVVGVDFAPGLGAELGPRLAELGGEYVEGDALSLERGTFDLVLEHTFHCALPPEERPRWAALMRRSVAPGGDLAVLIFPGDKPLADGGPPYRTVATELGELLGEGFELVADEPAQVTRESRQWLERWARFRRSESGA